MALLNQNALTLLDHMKRMDPNGRIAPIVELLQQENPVLQDALFIEGNLPTGHRFTSRTALPTPAYRRLNKGIKPSKSRTEQIDEACAMLAARSSVDCKVMELNGNSREFRATEEAGQLQGLNNEVERGMFYNSTLVSPDRFMGLGPRLDNLNGPWKSQIIPCHAAASGSDQTSIWLVGWGAQGVHGIFPKGSQVGIKPTDMGKQYVSDGEGGEYLAYCTDWEWDIGLCVRDYRRVARICNIDLSAISSNENAVMEAMVKAWHRVKRNGVNLVWYCSSTVATYLHLQALNAVRNSTLSISEIGGQPITRFLGAPIKESEGILDNEAVIA